MKSNSFRTEITCPPSRPINLKDSILTTGSCFADQFGAWLVRNKFNVMTNPFGTNYNPVSIHQSLIDSIYPALNEQLYIQRDGIWYHFYFHSGWSSPDKEKLNTSLQQLQHRVREFAERSSVLIITYGTAWVYEHKDFHCVVSNCHKVPSAKFEKRLLSIGEITSSFSALHKILGGINSRIRIILTVSPVRHIKDTLVLNSVSKAVLRLACHELSSQYENVEYFPSFEIMMDDLRDYRFYDRDKIHPNAEAVDYISEKFSDQYFTAELKSFIDTWTSIRQAMEHRPFHPDSAAHQRFLKELINQLEALKETVSVEAEIRSVQSQLSTNA